MLCRRLTLFACIARVLQQGEDEMEETSRETYAWGKHDGLHYVIGGEGTSSQKGMKDVCDETETHVMQDRFHANVGLHRVA